MPRSSLQPTSTSRSHRMFKTSHVYQRVRNNWSQSPPRASSSETGSSRSSPFVSRSSSPLPRSSSPPRSILSHRDSPDEEDILSDPEPNTTVDNVSNDYLVSKGRILGQIRLMWDDLHPILEEGMLIDASKFVRRRRWASEYRDLISVIPLAPDLVLASGEGGLQHIAAELDFGRGKAHATDVSTIKANIHQWYEFQPAIDAVGGRHLLGFHHAAIGHMLCPADLDWDDPSIRKALQDGKKEILPSDFPHVFWKDEIIYGDFFEGFMQGELVVKAFLHIFIGPSAANDTTTSRSTRQGNAAIHGITTVTIYAIAYAATILRFVLSGQSTMSRGARTKGKWPYKDFYNELVQTMQGMDTDDLEDLMGWWQDTIFGGYDDENDDEDNRSSMAARMRAQAKEKWARKAAEEAATTATAAAQLTA
ncbi:hypothetical protein CPB84DRAFT_1847184 [Gymnopilus junonius]|uniref:Uncharacterized protein n=1 Tax=Gymnopilus junonius TaxID=109634 RepID=A0A9P5NQM7_GYMJU|nr:hypothetical protein CPB84DRAFT_1847184 [Gymnopilus junonius]